MKSLKVSTHKASSYPLPAFTSMVHTGSKLLKKCERKHQGFRENRHFYFLV